MKLNIGCGNNPLGGYINIDKYYYPECARGDLDQSKIGSCVWQYGDAVHLDFPDEMFDEVIMVHCLEHLSMDDGNIAIGEAARVLKKGGSLEIEVPNLATACKLFLDTPIEEEQKWLRVMGLIYGTTGVDGAGQFHLTGYTPKRLGQKMQQHGIVQLRPIPVGLGHGRPEPNFDFRLIGKKE